MARLRPHDPDDLRRAFERNQRGMERSMSKLWGAQGRRVAAPSELLHAIRRRDLTPEAWERLSALYTEWVNTELSSYWSTLANVAHLGTVAAIERLTGSAPPFDAFVRAMDRWGVRRAGNMITGLNAQQRLAVRNLLQRAIPEAGIAPANLARMLEPVVGLTDRYGDAVARRFNLLVEAGFTETQAANNAAQYAAKLRRVRAVRIARTETSEAFNTADYTVMEQSFDEGLLDRSATQAIWETSADERVCSICGPLDGQAVAFGTPFEQASRSALHPPIHPACRCTLTWETLALTS